MGSDPPLGPCPPWCQKPEGHDWEDEWKDGPIRYHQFRMDVARYHSIGIDEIEQWTPDGVRRQRELVLDVEAPTQWDRETALRGVSGILTCMGMAMDGWPEGAEVR